MNAVSTPHGAPPGARDFPPDLPATPPGDVALSLQFFRAGIMSLMRLQLAFERGDRMGAMETIDRLHALDAEAERVLMDLPGGTDDPRHRTIAKTLRDEKMAIAFEKLALASGIGGPDIASPPSFLRQRDHHSIDIDNLHIDDGSPIGARLFATTRRYGARAALLLVIGAGTIAMVMAF
ncbi:hypothetical protein [Sphingopyxis lindanitolerans]|uniref:hypothetical protein n=1 Tax=Sphingopyxis lindanitolerans TaxID=2054227 RepID=UPI0011B1F790|nr:hypothetical protein [Sphingopyxis lindanitolerans]